MPPRRATAADRGTATAAGGDSGADGNDAEQRQSARQSQQPCTVADGSVVASCALSYCHDCRHHRASMRARVRRCVCGGSVQRRRGYACCVCVHRRHVHRGVQLRVEGVQCALSVLLLCRCVRVRSCDRFDYRRRQRGGTESSERMNQRRWLRLRSAGPGASGATQWHSESTHRRRRCTRTDHTPSTTMHSGRSAVTGRSGQEREATARTEKSRLLAPHVQPQICCRSACPSYYS